MAGEGRGSGSHRQARRSKIRDGIVPAMMDDNTSVRCTPAAAVIPAINQQRGAAENAINSSVLGSARNLPRSPGNNAHNQSER